MFSLLQKLSLQIFNYYIIIVQLLFHTFFNILEIIFYPFKLLLIENSCCMLLILSKIRNMSSHIFLIVHQLIYFIIFLLDLFLKLIDNFHFLLIFVFYIIDFSLIQLFHLILLNLQLFYLTNLFSNNCLQSFYLLMKKFFSNLTLLLQSNILFNKTLYFMLLPLKSFSFFAV